MVFSVQQGEHGPLVVYKLQLPKAVTEPAKKPAPSSTTALPPPATDTGAKQPRLSPLKPRILGTVVMPRSWRPAPNSAAPTPLLPPPLSQTDLEIDYRTVADAPGADPMVNPASPNALTLDEVTEAVEWRRDTVERLRQAPIAPRF